jgi:Holliday junction DNA helicase RuvA
MHNKTREEALMALLTLGFAKNASEKAIDRSLQLNADLPVEHLIKEALKNL